MSIDLKGAVGTPPALSGRGWCETRLRQPSMRDRGVSALEIPRVPLNTLRLRWPNPGTRTRRGPHGNCSGRNGSDAGQGFGRPFDVPISRGGALDHLHEARGLYGCRISKKQSSRISLLFDPEPRGVG
jgi:hypothetical protein